MAWLTLSDPYLAAAFWTGALAFASTLLLSVQIVALRVRLRMRERRARNTIANWRPVLNEVLVDALPAALPPLRKREEIDFFKLWLHFQISLRGDARAALNRLAYQLHCDQRARRLLAHGSRAEQLIAILVLGHLKDQPAYAALQRHAAVSDRLIAMHASWALVRIDPDQAARNMAPYLVNDSQWPVREVVTVLQEARAACAPVLLSMVVQAAPASLPRLLQLIEGLRITLPSAVLAGLLRQDAVEVLISALRVAADPALHGAVLVHLKHPDWRVRLQAAKTVGRIGQRNDVAPLAAMLADGEWWVRYRAAQALASLPFLKPDDLLQLAAAATDRFAGDIVRQVIAEARSA